ncbi:MAG: cobalamin biosynthesis protein CbiG [Leptonema illini]|uniref:Cobalamin biosynthesis protein CbiG n=1 Tax=Leptonema illini TaxID=183 RepID=A0A833LUY3_9LEPT|nr:MAG: cobalamin biosynthesis protein CbiG [Leptonema illini]
MKISVLSISSGGKRLAARIAGELGGGASCHPTGASLETLRQAFASSDAMVCIMSAGIVVRAIGQLCRDKQSDPCVVVLDEAGRHVISLLSGHLGGGNDLALRVAAITGGQAVITTASDVLGLTPIDLWAEKNGFAVRSERRRLTEAAARLVNEGKIRIFSHGVCVGLPADFLPVDNPAEADIILSWQDALSPDALCLLPRNLFVGIGCNRGTPQAEIDAAVKETMRRHNLHRDAVAGLATIDAKIDEVAILAWARQEKLPLHFFSKERLNEVTGLEASAQVIAAVGARGVAEPAAMLAAAGGDGEPGQLIVSKIKWKNVTTAVVARKIACTDL